MLNTRLVATLDAQPWAHQTVFREGGIQHLIAAAKQAAADNRVKARNEAGRGAFKFAKLHEVASISYDEDAEAMIAYGKPIHRSVDHYVETECAYRRLTDRKRASNDNPYAVAS